MRPATVGCLVETMSLYFDYTLKLISYHELPRDISPDKLQAGSICAALSEDSVLFLMTEGEFYAFQQGEQIYEHGAKTDGFFIVCDGIVDLYKKHNEGICHIRSVENGEEFGFVAMISLVPRIANSFARDDCILLKIPTPLFHQLHQRYPFDFGLMTLNLSRDMARTINKVSDTLVDVIYD